MRARLRGRADWPESGRRETPTVGGPPSLGKSRRQARSREQCLPVLRELCQPRVSAQPDSPPAAEDKPGTRAISRDIHTPDCGKLMGVCSLEVGQVPEATTRHDGWAWGAAGAGRVRPVT